MFFHADEVVFLAVLQEGHAFAHFGVADDHSWLAARMIARGIERSTDVFGLPSDIAMPCALGGAVDVREAGLMTAKYVIEGANGPLTPGADAVLNERGVIIVPDIFANAGGVTCSYLEQCQNFAHLQWDEDEVNASVVATMLTAEMLATCACTNGTVPLGLRKGLILMAIPNCAWETMAN